ncbi:MULTISPECIES: quinone oxidoreductase family protein [Gordonia]|uniref:quinone oxidoreductase family protein n=1 Tax=Gordonia sp. 852002-51296_SCH5728562-b TaxID=1834101 RepID=UPI0007EB97DD|nr:NADP-dependent oxidoreductase [Gordonia sp. 852002-51296_SCH5728562-b]OBA38135.1 Zn-dependent oxidoreductase [Gordonia sp. 852002-51296_SCH5728562-b]
MADSTNSDSSTTDSAKTPTNENTLDIESAAVTARQAVANEYGEPSTVVEIVKAELPLPDPGQVVIDVTAIGVNPADAKTVRGVMGTDESKLPIPIGNELAGVVRAVGDPLDGQTPGFAVGDEVIAYPISGAYADHVVVNERSVHRKPAGLDDEHAASLLLAGVTAADAIATAGVQADDTVLIHGGAGAVGVIAVQLARKIGATVIATAAPANHDHLRELGAIPVAYGDGLLERVQAAAAESPVTVAIDTVGTDEAIDVSLALVDDRDRDRIVSIAAFGRGDDGIVLINGSTPQSKENRSNAIDDLIADAASGALMTDVAGTYPLDQAAKALDDILSSHPRGKFVLLP